MEPYWYGDEGIYLTLGNGVRHGLALYKDIHDNKPPGIYLIAAAAGSQFWFRFILLVWNSASIIVFWWIAHKLLDKLEAPKTFKLMGLNFPIPQYSTLATLLFGFLPFAFEGNIANGEIFMILPTLIGIAALIRLWKRTTKHPLTWAAIAGIAFSLGFLIKVPAIFDAIAGGVFFFLILPAFRRQHLPWWKRPLIAIWNGIRKPHPWVFGVAFLLPIVISIIYYWKIGALQPYLNSALLQNVGYLSSWKTGTHAAARVGQSGLKNRAAALGLATLVLLFSTPWLSAEGLLIIIWVGFSLFGSLLSERPYPHYLIQVIPPFCLLIIWLIKTLKERKHLVGSLTLGGITIATLTFSYINIKFWHYPLIPYYQNFLKFATGKINKTQYISYFDPTLPEQYMLARVIARNTTSQDRIFIWGDLPNIYALTRRLPPGRYTSAYHIKDFGGYEETYNAILATRPKFILIDRHMDNFPKLAVILDASYSLRYTSTNFWLYKRVNLK